MKVKELIEKLEKLTKDKKILEYDILIADGVNGDIADFEIIDVQTVMEECGYLYFTKEDAKEEDIPYKENALILGFLN